MSSTPAMAAPVPATGWRRRLAWGLFVAPALLVVVSVIGLGVLYARGSMSGTHLLGNLGLAPPALAFSTVGLIVALRRSNNPAGWQMLAIGFLWSLAQTPLLNGPGGALGFLDIVGSAIWVVPFGLMSTHLLLRLPDGALLSARWRWVSRVATLGMILASFLPTTEHDPGAAALAVVGLTGLVLILGCAIASIVSLVLRARRGGDEQRHQIRWVAAGAALFVTIYVLSFVPSILGASAGSAVVILAQFFTGVGYSAIPISIGVAILRYHLYDVDVVIRKTVVFAVVAVFITAVYVAVVVIAGALLVQGLLPSIAATAIVAVAFQPIRERANRIGNRLVYGKRASPYEVLSRFGDRVSGTYATEDVLPRTAHVVGEATGAERVDVWLHTNDRWRVGATWIEGSTEGSRAPQAAPTDGARDSSDPPEQARTGSSVLEPRADAIEIRHRGELLGAISVTKSRAEPLNPAEASLLSDLAGQAGLVLSNARLTTELQGRVDELARRTEQLRDSRRRIVAAHDAERRRLERNIHDGAQQHLVALAVKLRLAKATVAKDPQRGAEMLRGLRGEVDDAIETLTSLALGIYPPVLEERGIGAALQVQARMARFPVDVDADGLERAPIEAEAAVYFCCLEAIQNASKYAEPTHVSVHLERRNGAIAFSVVDDGRGFDPAVTPPGSGLRNMADRVSTVGGSIDIESSPGHGTTVRGLVPLAAEQVPA